MPSWLVDLVIALFQGCLLFFWWVLFYSTCWSFLGLNDHLLFHYILEEEKKIRDLAPRCHLSAEVSLLSFGICTCLLKMLPARRPPSQRHPTSADASLPCQPLGWAWSQDLLLGTWIYLQQWGFICWPGVGQNVNPKCAIYPQGDFLEAVPPSEIRLQFRGQYHAMG